MRELPVRDRRQGRRILTLKNAGWTLLVVAVVIGGVTIHSEMRDTAADDYGRLFGKQVRSEKEIPQPKFDVVKEAPVADHTVADPLLVAPAAREQYLGVNKATLQPVISASAATTAQSLDAPRGGGVAIVGGTDGVAIVRNAAEKRPTLAGGIFRQP